MKTININKTLHIKKEEGKNNKAHSYVGILIHYIFSTKNREKSISPEIQDHIWAYMGGIAWENNMKALSIGGIEDHAHSFLSLPSTITIAKGSVVSSGLLCVFLYYFPIINYWAIVNCPFGTNENIPGIYLCDKKKPQLNSCATIQRLHRKNQSTLLIHL